MQQPIKLDINLEHYTRGIKACKAQLLEARGTKRIFFYKKIRSLEKLIKKTYQNVDMIQAKYHDTLSLIKS